MFSASLFANDVITLKSGKIIEGEIYRTLPNGDICVHKTDGNDILIALSDIASRSRNDKKSASHSAKQSAPVSVSGLGLKAGYVHGFNSSTFSSYSSHLYSETTSTYIKNGNGFLLGVSYMVNLNRHFYFEPGFQISFLHYKYETTSYWQELHYLTQSQGGFIFKSSLNFLGSEVPLLFGSRTDINRLGEWNIKGGPSLTAYVDFDDRITNFQLGLQVETGVKFNRNHYVGIGANFCCYSGINEEFFGYSYDYLKEKRHRLNITYAYYF